MLCFLTYSVDWKKHLNLQKPVKDMPWSRFEELRLKDFLYTWIHLLHSIFLSAKIQGCVGSFIHFYIFTQFSHYAHELFYPLCTWFLYFTFSENLRTSKIKKSWTYRKIKNICRDFVLTIFTWFCFVIILFHEFSKKSQFKNRVQKVEKTHGYIVKIMYLLWFWVKFLDVDVKFVNQKNQLF